MNTLYYYIYRLGIELYYYAALIAAMFKPKAKLWVAGQRQTWLQLYKTPVNNKRPTLWVHCASLGEFEQGRSLIEDLKKQYPELYVVLTFFSPSGYEIRKNYAHANEVHYLLHDTPSNVNLWLDKIQPTLVIFIKYEYWYHYITELHRRRIPLFVVSAIFRSKQIFFQPYGALFRQLLGKINTIFVQNKASANLLQNIGITNVEIAPDTRFDTVANNAQQPKQLPIIAHFKAHNTLFVAGSTWQPDEQLLAELINNTQLTHLSGFKWVLVPHEVGENHLLNIEQMLKVKHLRYSKAQTMGGKISSDVKVLLIDNVGMLANIYAYAQYAYIGGGFGKGIHNILEAAVFGIPIFFGENYQKFQEATDLIALKAAFVTPSAYELSSQLAQIEDDSQQYKKIASAARNYVQQNKGGTAKIGDKLAEILKK